jgi:hypothetical protein
MYIEDRNRADNRTKETEKKMEFDCRIPSGEDVVS